jgi:tetratricopeptide (TPR) repeat protein
MSYHDMKKILLTLLLLTGLSVFGQNKKIFEQVKTLNNQRQYDKSIHILESYLQTRKDVYTLWLYGQTLHAAKKYGKALAAYQNALHLDPDNSVLKYDYALKSADAGKLNQAVSLIKPYAEYKNAYQFDALKKLAKFYYWQGAYDKADATLQKAKWFKNDGETKSLQSQINNAKTHFITGGLSYFSDDQPLTVISPNVALNYYLNEAITVGAELESPLYSLPKEQYTGLNLRPFVQFNIFPIATKVKLAAGYDKLPNSESVIDGKLSLSKYVMKNLNAEASFEYSPYLHTLTALESKLMQWHNNFALVWDDKDGLTGKLSFDQFNFSSLNNGYYAASAWVLSPKYWLDPVVLRAGLGINYSDATQNTFTANESLGTIIANYTEGQNIFGHYEPFFSPSQQLIASAVVSAQSQVSDNLTLAVDGNFGIYATTQNPYLFLNNDENNNIIIDRGFAQINYFPVTAKISADYLVSNSIALKAQYTFQSTNYYQSHLAGILALYKF